MTAPDPGLTDLIAAALVKWAVAEEARTGTPRGEIVRNMNVSDLANVAGGVVEQHTNGRTAELKAALREEAPYAARGHAMDDPDLSNCGDSECPGCEYDADALRAEKLEATISRVEKLAQDMRGWCSPHGISVTYSDRILAALEGES